MTVATRTGRRPEITADVLSHSLDLRDIGTLLSVSQAPPPPQRRKRHGQNGRLRPAHGCCLMARCTLPNSTWRMCI